MNWLCNLFGNTTFLTVISGVFVFTLGQLFIEFVLKPIRKYKELKADAAFCLRFYRPKFSNCTIDEAAREAAKELAAKFIAYSQEKPFWMFWVTRNNLKVCWEKLTLLYYCVSPGNEKRDVEIAHNCERKIVEALKLYGFQF